MSIHRLSSEIININTSLGIKTQLQLYLYHTLALHLFCTYLAPNKIFSPKNIKSFKIHQVGHLSP